MVLLQVIGPGTTISNPVELSDDDDTEEERSKLFPLSGQRDSNFRCIVDAVESVWKSNLQTSVLVGEIWLSGQRLAGHGPSSVAFKKPSSTVQSDPTLVIEVPKIVTFCRFATLTYVPHSSRSTSYRRFLSARSNMPPGVYQSRATFLGFCRSRQTPKWVSGSGPTS